MKIKSFQIICNDRYGGNFKLVFPRQESGEKLCAADFIAPREKGTDSFVIFVAILLYSYIFKLGYLKIATYVLFFPMLSAILVNIFKKNNGIYSKFFWFVLLAIFLYALLDKYFRLHIILAKYLVGMTNTNPVIMVNIIYVISFIIILPLFHKFLINEFGKNPDWIYLFILAILLKVASIFSDLIFHDITEDYFEVFSLYFFTAAFLLAFISNNSLKK